MPYMRITDIRESTESMRSNIRNAFIDFSQMTNSVVAVITDLIRDGKPVVGYGFTSNGRYAVGGLLRDRFIPRILDAQPDSLLDPRRDNFDPFRIWQTMMTGEKPGGHGERSVAVGAIDMAIWDLVAKVEQVPLYRLLANRFRGGVCEDSVFVYAAGGYYEPKKGIDGLEEELKSYLELGFNVVKMKIGGASLDEDLRRVEAALKVAGDGPNLAVDANGRFGLAEALDYARALEPYGLRWYEEPGDPLDYALMSAIAQSYKWPLATGENLFSVQEARNLVLYGGMRSDIDILQFDPALSYGLVEYLRTLEMLSQQGWSIRQCIPHGGHLFAVHIAAGLGTGGNESYPGVFQPFGGFTDRTEVIGGRVQLPDSPGIGYEGKARLNEILLALSS